MSEESQSEPEPSGETRSTDSHWETLDTGQRINADTFQIIDPPAPPEDGPPTIPRQM